MHGPRATLAVAREAPGWAGDSIHSLPSSPAKHDADAELERVKEEAECSSPWQSRRKVAGHHLI